MSAFMNNTPTPQEAGASTGGGSDIMSGIGYHFGSQFVPPNIQSEIKNEPPVEIEDNNRALYGEDNNSNERHATDSPRIRLTPTIKLMATPNPLDPKRKFACPYDNCSKSYGKSSHLRSHLTWHTGIKPFVCQEANCGKGFTRSDELNRHVRTHTGEKPFECIQCTKKFSRSDHLTKHLATHAKQMKINSKRVHTPHNDPAQAAEESESKKVYMDLQNPSDHMSYNEGMHFMAKLIESASQIKEERMDEPEIVTNEPISAQMPIKIKLEKPQYSDEYHVVPPTPIPLQPVALQPVALQPVALQPLLQPQLQQHVTASESEDDLPHEMIVPVSTMTCPPSPEIKDEPSDDAIMPEANAPIMPNDGAAYGASDFRQATTFVNEADRRPFRCVQCMKCFKRQDDLNRHVRTHTGEKPFACGECDRRFMRSDHLKKHLRTHTKIR